MSVLSNMAYACEYMCENTSMKEGYEGDNNLQQEKEDISETMCNWLQIFSRKRYGGKPRKQLPKSLYCN